MHDMDARLNFGNGNAEFGNREIQEAQKGQESQLGEELRRRATQILELKAALSGRATICQQLTKEPLMHYLGDGWKEHRDPHPHGSQRSGEQWIP
jgi:hypothetical protein